MRRIMLLGTAAANDYFLHFLCRITRIHTHTFIICIYIYICVCVCVCMYNRPQTFFCQKERQSNALHISPSLCSLPPSATLNEMTRESESIRTSDLVSSERRASYPKFLFHSFFHSLSLSIHTYIYIREKVKREMGKR